MSGDTSRAFDGRVIGALIVWHVRRRQREKALEHEPAGA